MVTAQLQNLHKQEIVTQAKLITRINQSSTTVTGNSNTTHDEIGNGNDTGNSIETIIVGDSNNSYVEVPDGDNNDIEVQVQKRATI